jgi:ABC-type Zn uptake system ZnuABC Zn-binding protein ZnuA
MKPAFTAITTAVWLSLFAPCVTANEPLTIYTVNYPLQYFAQRIAAGEQNELPREAALAVAHEACEQP